ncbi:FUSC family protein [Streptomyces sp. NPDC090127]|uniref:FUSC family protein n=1 Tax=Streptomyces sp. NPDC090127 TaxID=3365953 RepID=UPI00381F4DA2
MRGSLRLPAAYVAAARGSLRVTVAAAAGFYVFLYGFGQTVAATYALFAAVALGGLSRVPGTGRQRAGVVLRALPVAWVLVAVGTYLAVRTSSAVAGMLVIGFALAFVAVGGPRPAGVAPGLQLLYILPSFPPYAPGTLGERLTGTTVGLLLLALAEATLFRDPPALPYRELAARAADVAGRCAGELARSPYALSPQTGDAADAAAQALRPLSVPEAERPAGPGVRSRALAHTGLAARTLLNRLHHLPAVPPGRPPSAAYPDLLRAVGRSAADSAALLRGAPPESTAGSGLARERALLAAAPTGSADAAAVRRSAALLELADAALALSTAVGLVVRGRSTGPPLPLGRFWYARMRAPQLWWRRLVGNAGSRSVFFQNAVRIGLALAAARTVAGLDTLPHGFWAMLATLTLTRTTLYATRAGIKQAVAGTFIGALCTAGVLALVGTDTTVYAAVLVPVLLITFTVGPVKGLGWAQAFFALVVSMVFAQLAPATWQLAEVRLLDVLVGSAIGAVFGLLAWPRGAQREVRQSCAVLLRSAAEVVVATASTIAAGGLRDPDRPPSHTALRHALILAESAFAQFQSEPARPTAATARPVDFQAVLLTGHHTLWGADRLVAAPPGPEEDPGGPLSRPSSGPGKGPAEPVVVPDPVVVPPLDPAAALALTRLADRVAARMLLLSTLMVPSEDAPSRTPGPGTEPDAPGAASHGGLDDGPGGDRGAVSGGEQGAGSGGAASRAGAEETAPAGAPGRYYATESWLDAVLADLGRITDGRREGLRAP